MKIAFHFQGIVAKENFTTNLAHLMNRQNGSLKFHQVMPHKSADSQHLQVEWNETLDYRKLTQKEKRTKSIKTRILTLQIIIFRRVQ